MLQLDDVQRPQLFLAELEQCESWTRCQALPNPGHRWNVHLNQLTLATLLPWMEQANPEANQPPSIWPNPQDASRLWEWLSGTLIETTTARLLLMPTDTIETSELRVPQEWVDIPTWLADYYVLVQLNPDAGLLQIRGYVSHRQLKQGTYSADDRTYSVDESVLVQDLDLLWVMAQLECASERRASVAAIPGLSAPQAEALIQQWGQKRSPHTEPALQQRLRLPFEQWAALLSQHQWRERLHQDLHPASATTQNKHTSPIPTTPLPVGMRPVQLSQWFKGSFETAWLALEQLLGPSAKLNPRQLKASSVSRGKVIYLETIENPLVLCTTVTTESDGRVGIRIQLRPPMAASQILEDSPNAPQLAEGLQLALLSPSNDSLQVVTARAEDDYIQLSRFKVVPGQTFSIEVSLAGYATQEQFQV